VNAHSLMWINPVRGQANIGRSKFAESSPMIEYAIFMVMVIFTVGFAWLWFIEQKKKRTRREALERAKKRGDGYDGGT
jgi:hypothetical protein